MKVTRYNSNQIKSRLFQLVDNQYKMLENRINKKINIFQLTLYLYETEAEILTLKSGLIHIME